MFKVSSRLIAATVGLCLVAGSASAGEVHIAYTGLDLARSDQARVFQSRVERVAREFCEQQHVGAPDATAMRRCHGAVWDEVMAQLPAAQGRAVQAALAPDPQLASAGR